MTTITIHQPDFAPWLGFFDRWRQSDLYVVLDDVQFLRRGWHHRDCIKTPNGRLWLTVPVKKKGRFGQLISEVEIDDTGNWRSKHLKSIERFYGKTRGFEPLYSDLQKIYGQDHERLMDFNISLLSLFSGYLGIKTPVAMASDHPSDKKSDQRLIELMQIYNGDIYLTGTGAGDYLSEQAFEKCRIKVKWQKFNHPVYPQVWGDFLPGLSIIDFLMNRTGRA